MVPQAERQKRRRNPCQTHLHRMSDRVSSAEPKRPCSIQLHLISLVPQAERQDPGDQQALLRRLRRGARPGAPIGYKRQVWRTRNGQETALHHVQGTAAFQRGQVVVDWRVGRRDMVASSLWCRLQYGPADILLSTHNQRDGMSVDLTGLIMFFGSACTVVGCNRSSGNAVRPKVTAWM